MNASKIVELLKQNHLKISFCESCTGGLLASSIISVSGASNVIEESYITYSNQAKVKILGVKNETIEKFSVYSKEVSKEMVEGLKQKTLSDVLVSVTGMAQDDEKIRSFCYFAIIIKDELYLEEYEIYATRNKAREAFANHILNRLLVLLEHKLKA